MSQKLRVAVGGFSHETHSFSPVKTDLADFMRRAGAGAEMISRYRKTNTEMGGYIDAAEELGIELIPLVSASAGPSGPVSDEAYETIKSRLLTGIQEALPLDGVLLSLHGAMVTERLQDPEGDLISSVRALVGPDTVVGSTFDLHGNISPDMVRDLDLLFAYKTYPHIDGYEQAVACARAFVEMKRGDLRPTRHIEKPPWMPHSMNMRTAGGPMAEIEDRARGWERHPGVVNVSVFGGFPWSDVFCVGFSVVVTTNGDPELAEKVAKDVAAYGWDRRRQFTVEWTPLDRAIDEAVAAPRRPVVLVDAADNPGSGGTGDTTGLLRTLVSRGVRDAVVALIKDPETVAKAIEVGVGNSATFCVGGKDSPEYGAPVQVEATVRTISDGVFTRKGPMSTGTRASVGRVAVLEVNGLEIVVSEVASSTNDPELLRRHGIEPTDRAILALKVKGHFRAAFEPIVARIIEVDLPGLAALNFGTFNYRHIPRPIYPLDAQARYGN